MQIKEILSSQRTFFSEGMTQNIRCRKDALLRLREAIKCHEDDIFDALRRDLGKCPQEAYMTEIGLAYQEIDYMIKKIKVFSSAKRVRTALSVFPAKCYKQPSPYGSVLIMSPWNYPFLLAVDPLIAALAAGNTVVLKPSNYSPATSKVIKEIVTDAFNPSYVAVIEGGREANAELLDQKFDYIFFTGGKNVGRLVMAKASENLTPVTLELGGKSPCIVDETADIAQAAKRIVFGKYMNAGQTCVAPDYVLVQTSVLEKFLAALKGEIAHQFGAHPLENEAYGKIINEKHFYRLLRLIKDETAYIGGGSDADVLKIEPTVLTGITRKSPVMQEEIFGPILPVIEFNNLSQVFEIIADHPTPLSLYLFTKNPDTKARIMQNVLFGGGCVNDTVMHLSNNAFGFGGVGDSGMGSYHGKYGFDTFTHYKSIVEKKTRFDLPARYRPYNDRKFSIIRKFL